MRDKSQWQPLRSPLFRAFWTASIASHIGTLMQEVSAGWLMASLTPDPLMVSLVQAAASLPMFLLVLPSGVVSDIVDRRVYLLFAQLWMMACAGLLGVVVLVGLVTPWVLLGATIMLGIGAAMAAPPMQALLPHLVPNEELTNAAVLTALGGNIGRAVGPVAGGLLLVRLGPGWVFMFNAVSVLGIVYAIYRWEPEETARILPSEHFLPALRAGIRYVAAAPLLRVVVIRAISFFVFSSAAWSVLPLIASKRLGLSATGYGVLMSCLGIGAVIGAVALPRLKRSFSADALLTAAAAIFSFALLVLACFETLGTVVAALALAGFAWITALTLLSIGAQGTSAGWVKSRALAIYLVAVFGATASGSMLWGLIVKLAGIQEGLMMAGVGMIAAALFARRLTVEPIESLDLSPLKMPFSEVYATGSAEDHERRQVMVTVEYIIDPADEGAFATGHTSARALTSPASPASSSVLDVTFKNCDFSGLRQ